MSNSRKSKLALIFIRAWAIARQAVLDFFGKVKQYFSEALKMAYKESNKVVKKLIICSTTTSLKPHKAVDAEPEKWRFPSIVQPKIDGVRACYLNDNFTSRTLKPFRNSEVMNVFNNPLLQGLDGELAHGSLTSPSLCRDTTGYLNSFSNNTTGVVTWNIFDWVSPEVVNLTYSERMQALQSHLIDLESVLPAATSQLIKLIPASRVVHSIDDVLKAHEYYISQGYEGTIIRDTNGKHKNGRSTQNESYFTRLKDTLTEEAVILEVFEAKTNNNIAEINELGETSRSSHKNNFTGKGMIGSLKVKIPDSRIITIGAGQLTHEERYTLWEKPPIGRICTYKCMKYGEKSMRRQPRFVEFRDENI